MTLTSTVDNHAVAACRELVVGYHRAIDRGRATAGIRAFAEDAEFEVHGRTLRGRAEILGFLTDRESRVDRHTVHVIVNESVVSARDDEVELGAFVLLHVRASDGTYRLERVLDTRHTFRPIGSGWQVVERRSQPLHPVPTATGGAA